MLRISGGQLCGRRLASPAKDQSLRPTTERVREALFSMLADRLPGAQVLDLFAGTGMLGLEALSRGAGRVLLVEHHPAAQRLIRTNMARCGIEPCGHQQRALLMAASVGTPTAVTRLQAIAADWGPFDLVLMDPPWQEDQALIPAALTLLAHDAVLQAGAWVVAEHESPTVVADDPPWHRIRQRRYGRTWITIWAYERSCSAASMA
ncbi:MAG: 16S rRNA (guanine(966)-N(2))-methyltransferase RsmD [Magnetococcales bacterium]|nr:16S rRNA (guanine(966)-N(2))-methyltransferase RsmD [Magnetococcales bacterium]